MAKFVLPVYNIETGEVEKWCKRNFMPVDLYIRFQQLSENVITEKLENDMELFVRLKELFVELFPELTEDEYMNKTDVAEILLMFRDVIEKATQFVSGDSKKA